MGKKKENPFAPPIRLEEKEKNKLLAMPGLLLTSKATKYPNPYAVSRGKYPTACRPASIAGVAA